jgi:hypothetical protein
MLPPLRARGASEAAIAWTVAMADGGSVEAIRPAASGAIATGSVTGTIGGSTARASSRVGAGSSASGTTISPLPSSPPPAAPGITSIDAASAIAITIGRGRGFSRHGIISSARQISTSTCVTRLAYVDRTAGLWISRSIRLGVSWPSDIGVSRGAG